MRQNQENQRRKSIFQEKEKKNLQELILMKLGIYDFFLTEGFTTVREKHEMNISTEKT